MKKIPTLFKREFEDHKVVRVLPEVTEGMEWVLEGEGIATEKLDGAACAVIGGELYKRYDAKNGKPVPNGAIKCQEEPDPVTGHFPCWVKCSRDDPADKWFYSAFDNSGKLTDGTYEAIGPHFQNNPYNYLNKDLMIRHGATILNVERSFEGIKHYLEANYIEGIVFWKDNEPRCKIKRSDFGLEWGNRKYRGKAGCDK